jgi:hypothetical protein
MATEAYNPLDKLNIAKSIETEFLGRPAIALAEASAVVGAGVYALYYAGGFGPYASIRADPTNNKFGTPIYVGKAIPKGGRKGGLGADSTVGKPLANRLRRHLGSVSEATNLDLSDFWFRFLVVDDVWIPLGENMLIETFKPVWNLALDGFGNSAPGRRREGQFRSLWDTLHPGRASMTRLPPSPVALDAVERRVQNYLMELPLEPLPKAVEQQLDDAQEDEA